MKVRDANILFVPGTIEITDDHWQRRWQTKLPNTKWITRPKGPANDWIEQVKASIRAEAGPLIIVSHADGVAASRHAVEELGAKSITEKLKGVLFVAPPDLTSTGAQNGIAFDFDAYPSTPMPVPSFVVASRNDPYSTHENATELAADWGSLFLDAGESGHIDEASGHGPWPEGLMVFAEFMKRL